jgi:molecular chaperone GrpE (heat shock protein)
MSDSVSLERPSEPADPTVEDATDSPATHTPDKEPAPSMGADHDDVRSDALKHLEAVINGSVERILDAFERKLAYDATKQVQVDRLHAELQEHRAGLVNRVARPLVNGMIRLHDGIGKLVVSLQTKSPDDLTPERFFALLEGLQGDIEILLEQNGVVAYREPSGSFDPRRQRAIKTVVTHDPQLGGQVADAVRPGFEQGNEVLEKERVVVYQWQASSVTPADPNHPPVDVSTLPVQSRSQRQDEES